MRKILSLLLIILLSISGLLLLTNCKPQETQENIKVEATGSLKLNANPEDKISEGAAIEEGKIDYANDFTLLDIDKKEVSLSDFQGKFVMINFWATWCPPCRAEIPDLIEANNLLKDENVQFIGVSVDTDMKALEEFVKDFGINYPTLIDGTIDYISPKWDIKAIPTTFILNKNGEILFKNVGRMTKEQLIKALEEVL